MSVPHAAPLLLWYFTLLCYMKKCPYGGKIKIKGEKEKKGGEIGAF